MLRGRQSLTVNDSPKCCVIGAGAMGCLCGGKLMQAGCDVILLDIWPQHVAAINETGLVLDHPGGGSITIRGPATTDAGRVSGASLEQSRRQALHEPPI